MTPIKITIERAREILSQADEPIDSLGDLVIAGEEIAALAQYRIDAEFAISSHEETQRDDAVDLEQMKIALATALADLTMVQSQLRKVRETISLIDARGGRN